MKRFIFLALLFASLAAPAVEANGGVRTSFFFSTRTTVLVERPPVVFVERPPVILVDPCPSHRSYGADVLRVESFRSHGISRTVVRDRGFFFGNRTVIRSR